MQCKTPMETRTICADTGVVLIGKVLQRTIIIPTLGNIPNSSLHMFYYLMDNFDMVLLVIIIYERYSVTDFRVGTMRIKTKAKFTFIYAILN